MVQIIQSHRQKSPSVAQKLVGGALQGGMSALEKYQNMKNENKGIERTTGLDLSGIQDSNTRNQLIADQLAYGRKWKQAQGTANIDYGLENTEENKIQGKKPQEFEVTNNEKLGMGNIPQPETTGQKRQLFTPEEVYSRGAALAAQYREKGTPMSDQEGIQIAREQNQENKAYNQEVESDLKQRVETQRTYGNKAVEKLESVYPEANDEIKSLFKRKGEEAAEANISEAAIEGNLSQEARKFKNTLANVKKSIEPKRLLTGIKQALLGTGREFEEARNGMRVKLAPLLDEGLYDTARNLLSELGYHPEERESIISDLGEGSKKIVNSLPKMNKEAIRPHKIKNGLVHYENGETSFSTEKQYSPKQLETIQDNIKQSFKADPTANLVLLRKAYEGKDVDWKIFDNTLNDAILNGEIKLTDDQFNQLDTISQPPLNNLEKILHGLNLIGR